MDLSDDNVLEFRLLRTTSLVNRSPIERKSPEESRGRVLLLLLLSSGFRYPCLRGPGLQRDQAGRGDIPETEMLFV